MNASQFASLGSSAHAILVAKRHALVAATARVEAIMDADPCDHVCRCAMRADYDAAVKAESEAHAEVVAAEAAWASYCEIRRADIGAGARS